VTHAFKLKQQKAEDTVTLIAVPQEKL
jgi:hypothetical protein